MKAACQEKQSPPPGSQTPAAVARESDLHRRHRQGVETPLPLGSQTPTAAAAAGSHDMDRPPGVCPGGTAREPSHHQWLVASSPPYIQDFGSSPPRLEASSNFSSSPLASRTWIH
jgi:hypothetical protein